MNTLNEYYSHRVEEYEDIYYRDDLVRQNEQTEIHNELRSIFKNKSVLEVACGTGYWTKTISEVANNILAIDYSKDVIDVAKSKNLSADFLVDDAYKLKKVENSFNGGCANFWFSHVPRNIISEFLNTFHDKLAKGSHVFMADNIFLKGIGGDLIRKQGDENTYKVRTLSDGSTYEIIKNYYSREELAERFKDYVSDIEIIFRKCFWWIKYKTR